VTTDIEVTFRPAPGGTLVRLTQSGFERVGEGAEGLREGYTAGWVEVLDWFAARAALSATGTAS
jgi:hypothetical protein